MRELVWIFLILLQQHGGFGEDADLFKSNHNLPSTTSESHTGKALVKRYAKDPFSRRSGVDKNFIRFGRSGGDYFHDAPDCKHKNPVSYARVSRAARDNFMRFGRPEEEQLEKVFASIPLAAEKDSIDDLKRLVRAKDSFMRFGRGKDNFMRFGRGKDNFMRFGRGKDNFMRFGRGKDNFMRFGRAKDSFMRFGRGKDNFMRFGRNYPTNSLEVKDLDLSPAYIFDTPSGKKQTKSLKNQSGFIRFGRSDPEADPEDQKIDDDESEIEGGGLDLQGDKPKNGPIIRIKRDAQATLWDVENDRARRDLEVMDQIGTESADKGPELRKRYVDLESNAEPEREFIVSDEDVPEFISYFSNPDDYLSESKRSNGGSNFIRFG